MAENAPATDAGTPTTPARSRRRRPSGPRNEETAASPPAGPLPRKKTKIDIAIEEAAARLAAEAPPLSEGQRRRIAELFAPAVSAVKR